MFSLHIVCHGRFVITYLLTRTMAMTMRTRPCAVDRYVNHQVDSGATAVYLACQEGHVDVVRHLVEEAGASLKLRCYDGMSCLHAATQSGQLSLLQWLVRSLCIHSTFSYLLQYSTFACHCDGVISLISFICNNDYILFQKASILCSECE